MPKLILSLALLITTFSFAADTKYLKIKCYPEGNQTEPSFNGLIAGSLEITSSGYILNQLN